MRRTILIIGLIFLVALSGQNIVTAKENRAPRIELIGNDIYLDGKKFFIKGVGYSPYRPLSHFRNI